MEDRRARHAAELEAKRKKLKEIRKRKENLRYYILPRINITEGWHRLYQSICRTEENKTIASAPPQEESKDFGDFIDSILKTSQENAQANESKATHETAAIETNDASAVSLAEKLANLTTVSSIHSIVLQFIDL